MGTMIIGVDFDNTVITYDDLIFQIARQRHWIPPDIDKNKKCIRDWIRSLPEGEIAWQKLQAQIYGSRIGEARLIEGVADFFAMCKQRGIKCYIVSHKTESASLDQTGTNLQKAAQAWMEKNNFFNPQGLGLTPQEVFFETTRQAKIARIQQLACTHFIDDLEETFQEESFPSHVMKLLYRPLQKEEPIDGVKVFSCWRRLGEMLFPE
jgi:hypothetical protein